MGVEHSAPMQQSSYSLGILYDVFKKVLIEGYKSS